MKQEKSRKNKSKKNAKYYVDPKLFQRQILKYHKDDIMTTELGESILNIATRLGYAPNFINYTYKEDMVGDAIVKMFSALKNKKFNPERGNPFSYFTKIAFNAFCNRIKKEKKARQTLLDYQEEVYETLADAGHISHANNPNETNEYEGYE